MNLGGIKLSVPDEEMLDLLPVDLKNNVMNTLDIYVEKGKKEGIGIGERLGLEKGEKLGLKKGERIRLKKLKITIENLIKNTDWNDQKIADITGETLEFVQSIRASLKK